jgi:flagellar hook assembly protein FlgD
MSTMTRFCAEKAGRVRLCVYDAAIRLVRVLADGALTSGPHTVAWDGRDGAGGRVFI